MCCLCFFFFKQKTAYEMRISDWSSDVCSSDLKNGSRTEFDPLKLQGSLQLALRKRPVSAEAVDAAIHRIEQKLLSSGERRSEERRGGKECVSTCRSRWSPDH